MEDRYLLFLVFQRSTSLSSIALITPCLPPKIADVLRDKLDPMVRRLLPPLESPIAQPPSLKNVPQKSLPTPLDRLRVHVSNGRVDSPGCLTPDRSAASLRTVRQWLSVSVRPGLRTTRGCKNLSGNQPECHSTRQVADAFPFLRAGAS